MAHLNALNCTIKIPKYFISLEGKTWPVKVIIFVHSTLLAKARLQSLPSKSLQKRDGQELIESYRCGQLPQT